MLSPSEKYEVNHYTFAYFCSRVQLWIIPPKINGTSEQHSIRKKDPSNISSVPVMTGPTW